MPKAVILTALPIEYVAVRAHLTDVSEDVHSKGTIYQRGQFEANQRIWDIALVEVGMGNQRAAVETERALAYFQPDVAMFVGVAGGLKDDVGLGDVVAASKVYAYEYGKAKEHFFPRPEVGLGAYPLVQRARQVARDDEWQSRIMPSVGGAVPKAIVGPIAAGAKVVASNRASTFGFLRDNYSDAAAVEMEGHGFLEAAHATSGVLALVVRGISDLIEGKAQSDSEGWQPKAASHAAAFAFEVLARFQPARQHLDGEMVPRLDHVQTNMTLPQTQAVKVRGVPPTRLRTFAGRKLELDRIQTTLAQAPISHPALVAIHGLSGVGKTQLCREFMQLHQDNYALTYWISAGEQAQAISSFAQLAAELQLPGFDLTDLTRSSRVAVQWLEQTNNWLLIFDNASPPIVASLLPSSGAGHILIFSNDPHWSSITTNAIRLRGLSPEDAVEFLMRRTGLADADAAARIANAFDYLPLALEQAAAYIETTGIDFESYEQLLAQRRPVLLDKKSPFSEYPESVYSAFGLNLQRASETFPPVTDLLNLVSFLSPSRIPRALLRDAMYMHFKKSGKKFDDFIFNELVLALSKGSLIDLEGDVVSTHPLLQAFARDVMPEEVQHTWSKFVLSMLVQKFPIDVDDSSTWPQCESLIDHVTSAITLADYRSWDDEVIESLYVRAGSYRHARGREEEAYELLGRALKQAISRWGPDDPEVALVSNNLLSPLAELGRSDEALRLGKRAIRILTRDEDTLDTYAIELGIIYNNIGRIYLNQKHDFNAARIFFRRALSIHDSFLGENHYTTAIDINNLGTVDREEAEWAAARGRFYMAQRKLYDAYPHFQKAVSIHRAVLLPSDYRLAVAAFNLGRTQYKLGFYPEAEVNLREAVEINDILKGGATQWDQMDALYYLGLTLSKVGKLRDSLVYFDRAIDFASRLYGREAPVVTKIQSERGAVAFELIRPFVCYYT